MEGGVQVQVQPQPGFLAQPRPSFQLPDVRDLTYPPFPRQPVSQQQPQPQPQPSQQQQQQPQQQQQQAAGGRGGGLNTILAAAAAVQQTNSSGGGGGGGGGGKAAKRESSKGSRSSNPYARPHSYGGSYGHSGPKQCAQCGTTRTPQWREGPEGPKTLCNACGVKRVRQLRVVQEGGKRRAYNAGALQRAHSGTLTKQPSLSLSSDSLDGHGHAPARPRAAPKRPQRRAAAKAASRTQEYISTGDWPDAEEDTYLLARSPQASSLAAPTLSADGESAGHHSDSAEEVAWTPAQRLGPPALSPEVPEVGHETAAAVNLLCMSVKDSDVAHQAALGSSPPRGGHSGPQGMPLFQAPGSHLDEGVSSSAAAAAASGPKPVDFRNTLLSEQQGSVSGAMQRQHLSAAAAAAASAPDPGVGPEAHAVAHVTVIPRGAASQPCSVPAHVQETLSALPPAKHSAMVALKETLDATARDAAAADAAVSAVAKILAIKQAAAIKARSAAAHAAKEMHSYMLELDAEYGWTRAMRARQRPPQGA